MTIPELADRADAIGNDATAAHALIEKACPQSSCKIEAVSWIYDHRHREGQKVFFCVSILNDKLPGENRCIRAESPTLAKAVVAAIIAFWQAMPQENGNEADVQDFINNIAETETVLVEPGF